MTDMKEQQISMKFGKMAVEKHKMLTEPFYDNALGQMQTYENLSILRMDIFQPMMVVVVLDI
jgi:hypothetical protein